MYSLRDRRFHESLEALGCPTEEEADEPSSPTETGEGQGNPAEPVKPFNSGSGTA